MRQERDIETQAIERRRENGGSRVPGWVVTIALACIPTIGGGAGTYAVVQYRVSTLEECAKGMESKIEVMRSTQEATQRSLEVLQARILAEMQAIRADINRLERHP